MRPWMWVDVDDQQDDMTDDEDDTYYVPRKPDERIMRHAQRHCRDPVLTPPVREGDLLVLYVPDSWSDHRIPRKLAARTARRQPSAQECCRMFGVRMLWFGACWRRPGYEARGYKRVIVERIK